MIALALAVSVPLAWAQDRPNHVLELDGDGDYVELPAEPFAELEAVTVEGWVKWDAFLPHSRFFDFQGGDLRMHVAINGTIPMIRLERAGESNRHFVDTPEVLEVGNWVHLAATRSGDELQLFVNGVVFSKTRMLEGNTTRESLNLLGRANDQANPHYLRGQIDELRVWNRVRTAEEVRANMMKDHTGEEEGLLALWSFEGFAEGVVTDSGPGGHHGTLVGDAKMVEAELPDEVESPLPPDPSRIEPGNEAVLFVEGDGGGVKLPDGLLDGLEEVTLEAWVRPHQLDAGTTTLLRFGGDEPPRLRINHREAENDLHLNFGPFQDEPTQRGVAAKPVALLEPGEWSHLAVVLGPEGALLYWNGHLVGTRPEARPSDLGKDAGNWIGQSAFTGLIDEVRLWKEARTEQEIREHLRANLTGDEDGLLALWNFSSVEENTVMDAGPNAHHGTLSGAVRIEQTVRPRELKALPRVVPDSPDKVDPEGDDPALLVHESGGLILPEGVLEGLEEATIEAWIRPSLSDRKFNFLRFGGDDPTLRVSYRATEILSAEFGPLPGGKFQNVDAHPEGIVATGEWFHVALVLGPDGGLLYYNGELAGHNPETRLTDLRDHSINWIGDAGGAGLYDEVRIWKVARTQEEVRETMHIDLSGDEQGLLSLWSFSEVDGATVRDSGPGGNDGEMKPATDITMASRPDRLDPLPLPPQFQAHQGSDPVLMVPGHDSALELPAGLITGLEELTIEGWMLVDQTGSGAFIGFGTRERQPYHKLAIHMVNNPSDLRLTISDNRRSWRAYPVLAEGVLGVNRWVHVAGVITPQGGRFYVNGHLEGHHPELTLAQLDENERNELGWAMTGLIDEVRLWRVARSEGQIRENLFARLKGDEEGLLALWSFDGDDGLHVPDRSPNQHDGKLVGGARVMKASSPTGGGWEVVSGVVSDARGRPVVRARVDLWRDGMVIGTQRTSRDGAYWLPIPHGRVSSASRFALRTEGTCGWMWSPKERPPMRSLSPFRIPSL